MPIEFDPAWEYWTPNDPEITELLNDAATVNGDGPLSVFDAPDAGGYGSRREWMAAVGLRFGRHAKDVDRGYFTLRRRTDDRGESNAPTIGVCAQCGDGFRLRRRDQRYCSGACREDAQGGECIARRIQRAEAVERRLIANDRRRKKLAEFVVQFHAGARMVDIAARLRVTRVSLALWRRQLGLERERPTTRKRERPERTLKDMRAYYARVERFAELYAARVPLTEIAAELGVDHTTLGRWRRRLGLVKRRSPAMKTAQLTCERCRVPFSPRRSWAPTRFCSTTCSLATTADKRRMRAASVTCPCGTAFEPRATDSKYCSRRCAARAGGDMSKPDAALMATFVELYRANVPTSEIAARIGRSAETLKKWRQKLGLSGRGRIR